MFASLQTAARSRPIVTACLVLAVLLGAANYYLWQTRHGVTLRNTSVRQKGEFMVHALESRPKVDAELEALHEGLAQIDGNLMDEGSMEVNLGYFYRLEKMTRVRLVRLNQLVATAPPANSPYKAVPFSMQVTGSYRNSMAFLRALESGPRILRVRNCSFERGSDSSEFQLELTVDVIAKAKA